MTRPGRKGRHEREERVRYILRHLDDPIMLQRSPVARSAVVEKRASDCCPNQLVARGRALHDLMMEWLGEVESSVEGSASLKQFHDFVVFTRKGMGTMEASRRLGMSAGHVSRTYKRLLVELLMERIMGTPQQEAV